MYKQNLVLLDEDVLKIQEKWGKKVGYQKYKMKNSIFYSDKKKHMEVL